MRHTITLSGSPQIKSQRIQCKKLPNMQQESVVRIEQDNKKLYAIYTPVLSSERSQISMKYLTLNGIDESLATMSKVQTPSRMKAIQIELSPLDYQLVNNNFGLLQRTFLDQVNIVWPGAKIPLYYNDSNNITLMPKVNQVNLVDPYAAISFTMIDDPISQMIGNNERCEDSIDESQEELGQKIMVLGKCSDEIHLQFGYDCRIYVSNDEFQYIKKFRNKKEKSIILCTMQPMIPFVTGPTFQEFLQYKKLQETQKIPELKPILLQISPSSTNLFKQWQGISPSTIHKINSTQQLNEIYFACSQICKKSLSLPQKLTITDESLNSFQNISTLSLQIFLNQVQSQKYQICLQTTQNKTLNQQDEQKLKSTFAKKFAETILTQTQFIFLLDYYPFLIEGGLFSLILQRKNSKGKKLEELKNFISIKNILSNNFSQQETAQITNRIVTILTKKVVIKHDFSSQKSQKWLPIIKHIAQKRINQQLNKNQQTFKNIFELAYEKQLKETLKFVKTQMTNKDFSFSKVLFTTYSSNGKTFLHQYFNEIQPGFNNRLIHHRTLRSWYLDCRTLVHQNNRFEEIKDYISTFVSFCPYRMVFFDNIDVLVPLIEQGDQMRQKEKTLSHVFGIFINKLLEVNSKIGIFTAKSQANIDPILKFDKITKLKNPNRQTRAEIMNSLKINAEKEWVNQFIDKTESFSLGSMNHYLVAQQIPVKKQSKRKNDFSKIVGLEQAKKTIRSVIEKPNKFGFIYDKVKIKVPRGILLYGATGNGKTALGSAVQDQFPMKFFTVKGSDILSKYIGGSEAAVRQVFEKALSVSPSVIFFDEFQSIVPRRNSSGTGVTDRVVNQFLCYLDGVSSTTGVFIIAASSRPDLIDPALLRPGRIDSHIYLEYPNAQERSQLLKLFENSVKLEISEEEFIASTQNYSYSDLIGLLKQLRIKKSSEVLKQKQNPQTEDFKYIHSELFKQTIKNYRIGTQIGQQGKQKQLYERFKCGKGPQIKQQKFIQV